MNLQRLKELAQRVNYQDFSVNHSGYGVVSSDGTFADCLGMDEATFIYAANPSVVLALIGKLEAAERDRDELKALAEEQSQLAGCNAARVQQAEAEIARRDAAASKPVAYVPKGHIGRYLNGLNSGCWVYGERNNDNDESLFTAVQPAVSPELAQDVKNIIGLLSENEWAEHCTNSELGRSLECEITRLHDLRAQPQKPVVLQGGRLKPDGKFWYDEDTISNILYQAGIEVKK